MINATHEEVSKLLTAIKHLDISVDEAIRRMQYINPVEKSCYTCKWEKLHYSSECTECFNGGHFKNYERK